MFELAAHLSSRMGTENVIFSTPHRYSTVRMRQMATTFGFEDVVGLPMPFEDLDPARCSFAVVLGNSIGPPIEPFGRRNVYQLQFPFYMSDSEVEKRATWLRDYDEVWVYSDFVRRHVNGLVRHYGLDCPPVRVIAPAAQWAGATKGLPWADRKTVLTVGRFFAGGHNSARTSSSKRSGRSSKAAPVMCNWPWPGPSIRPPRPESDFTSSSAWRRG